MTERDLGRVRTILVATDFSETAKLALERASELALDHSARIVLVNSLAFEPLPIAGPELMVLPQDFDEQLRQASLRALDSLVANVVRQGIEIEAQLESGPAAAAVVGAAERSEADLIVVGTRGNSGFKHLLLGSVAELVVRDARCPVLTVHPSDTTSLDRISCVLLPTDFSDDAAHVVERLAVLFAGRVSGAELKLLYVYQLPVMVAPLSGFGSEMPVLAEDALKMAREALDPLAEKLREAGFAVEVLGREGDPAGVITELASSLRVDLVAMGTRGFSGLKRVLLGSAAQRVVQHARCPVLTLRRGDA